MTIARSALVLGAAMGVYSVASVFVVVEYFPAGFGWLIPLGGLGLPIAVMWPRWFDRGATAGFGRRLGRRLLVITGAAPMGAIAAFLTVLAAPGFITWGDNLHRAVLTRQGMAATEIESTVAAHHQQPVHFLRDGALVTAIPGVIGALVSTVASAVMLRRRPSSPPA